VTRAIGDAVGIAGSVGVPVARARRCRLAAQLANCCEHLASMAKQDAHILEVLVSQMRRPPTDLTLSVLDPQDRKFTTRANKL
jgi:hypothetical protein